MRKKPVIILLVLLLQLAKGAGQNFPDLQFEHITAKDGLSSNAVTAIAEDKLGFMWIGTANGLNRYDGYRFKQYFHSNTDSNSLVNNTVQHIICDSRGRLWISTEDGISCFIPAENRFVNFSVKFKVPYHLKNNSGIKPYEDETGTVWLCNQESSVYKVLAGMTLEEVKLNLPAFTFFHLSPLGYDDIFRDRAGNEWAFKANRIYKLNKATRQPQEIIDCYPLLNAFILKMMQDDRGNYFIATFGGGFLQFLPGQKKILQPVAVLPAGIFTDIGEWDYKNKKWVIGLETNTGLCLLNPEKGGIKIFGTVAGDASSLAGNGFNQAFIDKKGNLWIASGRGINKLPAVQNTFTVMPATEPGTINYQVNKAGMVFSFFETDSSIWLSKRGVSTFEYDQEFRLKIFYNSLYPLSSSSAYYKNSWAYFFYKKGNLLYITTDSGLVAYNLLNRTSAAFFPSLQASTTSFRTIIPFNDNELMIRSFDKGIFIFNTDTKEFTGHFSNSGDCADCLPLRVNYLFKTKRNEIFVTTSSAGKGLMKFNQFAGSFAPVKAVNDEDNRMQVSDLFGMDEDGAGNLWITSSAGLFIYDPAVNRILPQQKESDEPGSLFRICFDNYGNTWANGPSGIWCFIKAKNKWINFNGQDGLPGSDFEGIIVRKKNGDIVAGLEGAVAIFHPGTLTEPLNNYPAIITESFVDNRVIPFPLAAASDKKLILGADQHSFSVDFAILNYLNPSASRYYYKLSPLMNDFKLNDNGHINFNGLAPGHYTLHVKGGDKTGNIFGKEDVLEIEVEPRWYQAGLFKALCIIAAAAIIFYFVRRRINAIKKEATFKQKIAETQMQALRAQMNPHFIFNSLNSIENFMMQNEKRLASDYLNKFSKLIRSILDSSRNELVPVAKDMEALQLYVDLEQLRFNNKFIYKTVIDPELINGDYRIPSLLIQPYVENAIVHGLAHSETTGLSLTVTATLDGDTIKYSVQDNGIGRQKAAAYNMQNKPHHKSVGLAITKDRIVYFNGPQFTGESVTITDLYGTEHEPCGTKVDILIKAL